MSQQPGSTASAPPSPSTRASRLLRGAGQVLLPGAVIALGACWLAALLSSVPDGVFFSGDGGLKALMARQLLEGRWVPWLELDQPPWVHELWDAGMYPFRPPFAHSLGGRWYSSFEWAFPAASAPAYSIAGHRGLYVFPVLGVAAVWLRFLSLLRALHVRPLPAAAALALLTFATPLTFYGATIWEHAPAVALAFSGYSDLLLVERDPRATRAIRAGLLLGAACWLRPEALVFGVSALAAHMASRHRTMIARGAAAFVLTFIVYLLFNRVVYGDWVGVHAIQLVERDRSASTWLTEALGMARGLLELWHDRLTFSWLALLLAGATLTSRGARGSASRRTMIVLPLAFAATAAIVPNNGGLQIGPRYLLLLMPLLALLVALGLEQLRPASRWARSTLTALALLLLAHAGYENVTETTPRLQASYATRILPAVTAIGSRPEAGVMFGHHWAAMEMSGVITASRPVVTVDDLREIDRAVEAMMEHGVSEVLLVDGPGSRRFPVRGKQDHRSVRVSWTVISDRGEYHVLRGTRVAPLD